MALEMNDTIDVKSSEWLKEGYNLFMENFGEIFIFVLVVLLIMAAAGSTAFASIIVTGPLMCSVYYAIFKKMRGEKVDLNQIGEGFKVFLPSLLATILMSIFACIGYILCIIPGIIINTMYLFVYPLIIERKMDFWDAMELSRKTVSKNLSGFVGFFLLIILISIGGALACCVGVLFTSPIIACATAAAYRDIFGLDIPQPPQSGTLPPQFDPKVGDDNNQF